VIPVNVNVIEILDELNRLGWKDYKIEIECGFSKSYVPQIRCGNVVKPAYANVAKLLNLLERERARAADRRAGVVVGVMVWAM